MQLLHISDLHFNADENNTEPHEIVKGLIDLTEDGTLDSDTFVLVSGDITSSGRQEGYREAQEFFKELLENTSLRKKKFLFCPGNHDIEDGTFDNFDTFTYSIRNDDEFTYDSNPCRLYFKDDYCFLGINTSYHLEHTYGKVDISFLSKMLEDKKDKISSSKVKVIFLHHHILNFEDDDNSSIKNSHQFFCLIKDYGFDFLFHGHQHAIQEYKINDIEINSVSSLFVKRAVSNILAIYNIDEQKNLERIEMSFQKDQLNSKNILGRFKKI